MIGASIKITNVRMLQGPSGPSAPVNLVAPVVSGSGLLNAPLSSTAGTWANSPSGFAYQWRRGGVDIAGSTASTYTPTFPADNGASITCRVTASNAGGSASAVSNAIAVQTAVTPANTALPVVTQAAGTSSLATTTGTWTGTPAPTFAYQWRRNGVAVAGANASTYTIPDTDSSTVWDCRVTATNASGSTTATAAAIFVGMLDRVSAAVAAALAPRRLRAGYTGPLIRVRRSSDNTELDIGSAFAIEPDIVTNGTFATDTFWTKGTGVTISGGLANCSGAAQIVTANIGMIPGRRYAIQFDFTCISGSALRVNNSLVNGVNVKYTQGVANGTSGTIRCDFVADNSQFAIEAANAVFTGTIDNVVVNPVLAVGDALDTNALLAHVYSGQTAVLGAETGYSAEGAAYTPASPSAGSLRIIEDTSTGLHRVQKGSAISLVSGTQYRIASIVNTVNFERGVAFELYGGGGALALLVGFRLSVAEAQVLSQAGVTGVSGSVRQIGVNSWICEIIFTATAAFTNPLFLVSLLAPGGAYPRVYAGDGTSGITATAPTFYTAANRLDAFVVTQYEQTAGGINITQSNAALQPRIVNAGVLDTRNGRPSIEYLGGQTLTAAAAVTARAAASVAIADTSAAQFYYGAGGVNILALLINSGASRRVGIADVVTPTMADCADPAAFGTGLAVYYDAADTALVETSLKDGTALAVQGDAAIGSFPSVLTIGSRLVGGASPLYFDGSAPELVLFTNELPLATAQAISRQQGAYYGVTIA